MLNIFDRFKRTIAENQDVPVRTVEAFWNFLCAYVGTQLRINGKVRLPGIATISVYDSKPTKRKLNGKIVEVPAKKKLKVTWSTLLIKEINNATNSNATSKRKSPKKSNRRR